MDFIADFKDVKLATFFLGLCEGTGVCPTLPASLEELKQRTTAALQTVTEDMLQCAWEELKYRIDVCRVSGGVHIEHL